MVDASDYCDNRQEQFRRWYELGESYDAYLANSSPEHADRWREMEQNISLSDDQSTLLTSFTREMPVVCVTGIWCGDCVRQGPILRAFEQLAPGMSVRWLDRDAHSDLMDELRVTGAKKVPVFVFLTEDFLEAGRFGDRTLSVYQRKAEGDLGPACPVGWHSGDDDALAVETQEWLDIVERMHLLLKLSPLLRERHGD
ncbi:MAG: thioredoxin family protein [Candidatus Latescibacteria bacterium]|jgi:thiol-disulfide isomerase/thioredoxin|nr:thioredoxin family protein [Candidatus Latescibacterota bacterium]